MLYTKKGDKGDTYGYGCDQRFSKNSELAEALGALDEINSLLGSLKIKSRDLNFKITISGDTFKRIAAPEHHSLSQILERAQQDLFIIQANLAGAKDKKITPEKIQYLEKIIDAAEKEMPPIKTFFLSGGTELSAFFDYARAIARRAERRVVRLSEKEKLDPEILAYMNRLSSLLYALARFVNVQSGAEQIPPSYK